MPLTMFLLAGLCMTGVNTTWSGETYHIVPVDYTGVANKNTGDTKGDIQFVVKTMHACTGKTNGRCMRDQVIETVPVSVVLIDGKWNDYMFCNIQEDIGEYVCCDHKAHPPCPPLKSCAVGREKKDNGGFWYAFPGCGEGDTWNQAPQQSRRINASCVGELWRKTAGSCSHCSSELDECVQYCVTNHTSLEQRQNDWYTATTDGTVCESLPFTPPALRWVCGSAGVCVQARVGHTSQEKCASTCSTPGPGAQYDCGNGECFQAKKGDYPGLSDCEAACTPPPAPAADGYLCTSAYKCAGPIPITTPGAETEKHCKKSCAPPATPKPAPATPKPAPATPKPTPATPKPAPATPKPAPATPKPTPTPTPQPTPLPTSGHVVDTTDGGPWVKVVEYKDAAYTPTPGAVGSLSASPFAPAGFAKLADAEINSIGGAHFLLRVMSSDANGADPATRLYLDVSGIPFNDSAPSFGLARQTYAMCASASLASCAWATSVPHPDCDWWAQQGIYWEHIDTLGSTRCLANDNKRWFADSGKPPPNHPTVYPGGISCGGTCVDDPVYGKRCFNMGGVGAPTQCAMREDVTIWIKPKAAQ